MAELDAETQKSDEELVRRLQERDESALAAVILRHGPKVKGFLEKRFGKPLDDSDRDEVFQLSLMKLWDKIQTYNSEKGSLKSWFIRIAHNSALDLIRGEKKHQTEELVDPAEYNQENSIDVAFPTDSREQERLRRVDNFIENDLQGMEKIIAINFFTIGAEPDSVRLAEKLGRSRNYVDTVKSKVKKKIREAILAIEANEMVERSSNDSGR